MMILAKHSRAFLVLLFFSLGCSKNAENGARHANPSQQSPGPALPPEVVVAWEKAGANVGWMAPDFRNGQWFIRPAPPERRARLIAERERLARLLEQARKESGNPDRTRGIQRD
jgi:hypothetical protein